MTGLALIEQEVSPATVIPYKRRVLGLRLSQLCHRVSPFPPLTLTTGVSVGRGFTKTDRGRVSVVDDDVDLDWVGLIRWPRRSGRIMADADASVNLEVLARALIAIQHATK